MTLYQVVDSDADGERTWSVAITAQTIATKLTEAEADALVLALSFDCQAVDPTWISHPHGCFCEVCFAFDRVA